MFIILNIINVRNADAKHADASFVHLRMFCRFCTFFI
jgi:hypothetical protein